MNWTRKGIAFAALSSAIVFSPAASAQAGTAAPPAFDAADIHSSGHVTNPSLRGGVLRNGRYDVRTASMLELISNAYGLNAEKVQGGPAWLNMDRFDISAKAPPDTPPATVKLMLQTLLAERFGLKVHPDTKPMQAYALTSPKGGKSKLKESDGAGGSECHGEPQNPPPPVPLNVVTCHGQTMDQIAQDLRDFGGPYLAGPVANQTGVEGTFDFTIRWTPRPALSAAGADGITIFDATEKQLGLKLDPGRVPLPVLVVDGVNQKPSPNPPGTAAALPPPPPAQFEVAVIKASNPDGGQPMGRLRNARLDAQNIPLKMIVEIAFEDLPDERLADAPKFLDNVKYDITAKAPPSAPGFDTDEEDLREMLRNLLADRFKMKSHMEERPVEGYVLSAVKPKLAKADPSNRTGCHEGPGADGKDPRLANPILGRLLACQNMTMAQFADQLPNLANGYAHVDVLDQTGLTEAYDFTLSFSTAGQLRGGPGQNPANPNAAASDPNGAISLPDAINRQLGLKLELKKRPMQVLVIDHIEEKPTEN